MYDGMTVCTDRPGAAKLIVRIAQVVPQMEIFKNSLYKYHIDK